jgi:hypothetical protein
MLDTNSSDQVTNCISCTVLSKSGFHTISLQPGVGGLLGPTAPLQGQQHYFPHAKLGKWNAGSAALGE